MQRKISATGTYRLPLYYRYLNTLERQGKNLVRSKEIGKATGQTDAQVRRDLTCFDSLGAPGKGYDVRELKRMLMNVLGKEKIRNVILVGVGNLGSALLGYKGLRLHYNIVAAFDNDIKKIGGKVGDVEVYDILHLNSIVAEKRVELALVCVPASAARQAINLLVSAGIRGILNFAPAWVSVPEGVILQNVDLSVELDRICYFMENYKDIVTLHKRDIYPQRKPKVEVI